MSNYNADAAIMPMKIDPFIPHDGAMSLLDDIISQRPNGITAQVRITEDALFAEPDGVPSWVGIEYMGQAIAAYAGLKARTSGGAVKIGFLVSTRRYEPKCSHFPIGALLDVSVDAITDGNTGLQIFACQISGKDINVQSNLNVFMPEDVDQFMQENML
jgi:predicted hotdog family 3-hydroxylacyl-ACP dehydratase